MKETKPEITLTHEQTIEKLLDNFDFQKVHKVMELLNWTYWDCSDIPDLERLRKSAKQALLGALHVSNRTTKKKAKSAYGGFYAEVRKYKDGEILFSLDFRVTDFNWSNRDTCY